MILPLQASGEGHRPHCALQMNPGSSAIHDGALHDSGKASAGWRHRRDRFPGHP